jgi:hypothetical protein
MTMMRVLMMVMVFVRTLIHRSTSQASKTDPDHENGEKDPASPIERLRPGGQRGAGFQAVFFDHSPSVQENA